MNQYWVKVVSDLPYPIEKEITVEASGLSPAVSRGIREYRKYIREIRGKKTIKNLQIKVMKL
jgi:hypothetical protein